MSLEVTYLRGRPAVAYLRLSHRLGEKAARTEQVGENLVVDYAADGSALGIEVVSPTRVTLDEIRALFGRLGLASPNDEDLAPLRAA